MPLSKTFQNQQNAAEPRSGLRHLQGFIAALSFSILLAGSNANTPLVPLYRSLLGFDPLAVSLTFACYVGVSIILLIILSHPSMLRRSPALLAISLVASILADLNLAIGSETTTLLGRALTGVAVGLGTGPAAALVVDAFGARGRSVSSTGNLVGAVIGTALSQTAVFLFDGRLAISRVFHLHALVCVVLLVVLLVVSRAMRGMNRKAFQPILGRAPKIRATLAGHWVPLFSGSIAWIGISIAITFLPSLFKEKGMLVVSSAGIIVLLICCAACQLASRFVGRLVPKANGMEAMLVGILLILAASFSGSQALGLIGFAVTGAGIGVSYRIALVILTKGAVPATHGVLSSTYAAITYAAAAISVTVMGMVGNHFGLQDVVVGSLVVLAAASIGLLMNAPRVWMETA